MTFRRLENMPIFSDRFEQGEIYNESNVNYLPALTKQHTSALATIYPYATITNGEMGLQFDMNYKFKKQDTHNQKIILTNWLLMLQNLLSQ